MNERILIADDEENIRYTFSHFLTEAGYQVDTASTLSQCIQKMQKGPIDLLFLDLAFGDDYGLEAIQSLKSMQPDCAILVITGNICSESIAKARKSGALDYLVKPIHQPSLLYITQNTLAKKKKASTASESGNSPISYQNIGGRLEKLCY
jgi:DNA-binding NtrC family response regulator